MRPGCFWRRLHMFGDPHAWSSFDYNCVSLDDKHCTSKPYLLRTARGSRRVTINYFLDVYIIFSWTVVGSPESAITSTILLRRSKEMSIVILFRIIIYSTLQVFFSKSGVFRMNDWMFRYSRSILFPIAFANAPVISASSSLVTKRNLAHTCYRRSEEKITLDEHIAKIARQGVQTPSESMEHHLVISIVLTI